MDMINFRHCKKFKVLEDCLSVGQYNFDSIYKCIYLEQMINLSIKAVMNIFDKPSEQHSASLQHSSASWHTSLPH